MKLRRDHHANAHAWRNLYIISIVMVAFIGVHIAAHVGGP
jgi:hypothetical protein